MVKRSSGFAFSNWRTSVLIAFLVCAFIEFEIGGGLRWDVGSGKDASMVTSIEVRLSKDR